MILFANSGPINNNKRHIILIALIPPITDMTSGVAPPDSMVPVVPDKVEGFTTDFAAAVLHPWFIKNDIQPDQVTFRYR